VVEMRVRSYLPACEAAGCSYIAIGEKKLFFQRTTNYLFPPFLMVGLRGKHASAGFAYRLILPGGWAGGLLGRVNTLSMSWLSFPLRTYRWVKEGGGCEGSGGW
jgi:hypothetical protein